MSVDSGAVRQRILERLGLPAGASQADLCARLGVAETATAPELMQAVAGALRTASEQAAGPLSFDAAQAQRLRATLELAPGAPAAAVVDAVEAVVADSLADLEHAPTEGPGHVVMTRAAFEDLERRVSVGEQSERDAYLDSVSDRYFPESRAAWEAQYDSNPEMTRHYLDNAEPMYPRSAEAAGDAPVDVTESSEYKEWKF